MACALTRSRRTVRAGPQVNKLTAKNWGNLLIAIDPAMLGDAASFYKNAGEVLERVRNAEKLPGVSEIIIPGERESQLAQRRVQEGSLPIESNMLQVGASPPPPPPPPPTIPHQQIPS